MTDERKPCHFIPGAAYEWCTAHNGLAALCRLSTLEAANGLMREALDKARKIFEKMDSLSESERDENAILDSIRGLLARGLKLNVSTPQHKALDEVRAKVWGEAADNCERRAKDALMEQMPVVLREELSSRALYFRERAAAIRRSA